MVTKSLCRLAIRWMGLLACVLTSPFWTTLSANAQGLSEDEAYKLARGLTGVQSPLFLFSGFKVFSTSAKTNGRVALLAFESPTIPDGPALGNNIILELQSVGFGLLEIPLTEIPSRWSGENDRPLLTMTGPDGQGPTFKGLWDQNAGGFFQFDLDLGEVRYEGDGIQYHVPSVRFSLSEVDEVATLKFSAAGWQADYAGSLDGTESAQDIEFTMSAAGGQVSPAALLTLANRLMALIMNISPPSGSENFDAPMATWLNGLSIKISVGEANWDTKSPPAQGGIKDVRLTLSVEPTFDNPEVSNLLIRADVGAATFALANNEISTSDASGFEISLYGLDARALAKGFYGVAPPNEGRDEANADDNGDNSVNSVNSVNSDNSDAQSAGDAAVDIENLAASVAFNAGGLSIESPDLNFSGSLESMGGSVTLSADNDSDDARIALMGEASKMAITRLDGQEALEPMASNLLFPMLPQELRANVALTGIERQAIVDAITALTKLDVRGVAEAMPKDLKTLNFELRDTTLKNELLDLDVEGEIALNGTGRIPLLGDITLTTGPLFPLQGAIQRSLSTKIPEVVQVLSAAIVGMTVIQSFAVPTAGGRFDYKLEFAGGLPTINGRDLRALPFMNNL